MSIPTKCKNLRLSDLQFSFIWESEYSLIMNKTKYFTESAEGPISVLGIVVVSYYQEQTVSLEGRVLTPRVPGKLESSRAWSDSPSFWERTDCTLSQKSEQLLSKRYTESLHSQRCLSGRWLEDFHRLQRKPSALPKEQQLLAPHGLLCACHCLGTVKAIGPETSEPWTSQRCRAVTPWQATPADCSRTAVPMEATWPMRVSPGGSHVSRGQPCRL